MKLKQAFLFGLICAIVLLAVSAGKNSSDDKGVYRASLISGLTDVDAITLSYAGFAGKGNLGNSLTVIGILLASVSNLAFKLVMIGIIATRQMFCWSLLCFACPALPILILFL